MKVVVVEDSELVRDQLLRALSVEPRLKVIGYAASEEDAVALILAERPDAVLLDLGLSPGSGLKVLRRVRAGGAGARVLVMTNNVDPALREACEAEGISGFFDKSQDMQACLARLNEWLPPLPGNETARLNALQSTRLLDGPEEETFDNITRLASDVLGAPMALISLVDSERQWFLSRVGIEPRETSRSVAFCAHAILHNTLMEVPDALADPRFRDNPLVTGAPHLRFYAGMPLVLASGEALGTLCVLDTAPRRLDPAQRDALTTLARCVLDEIELRRRVIRLEQEIERREVAEARIMHLATRDPLTALPNRVTFRDRLIQATRQAARHGGELAALFIDLDRFKLINDTLGHDIGDQTLVIAAQRLRQTLREADTVARLGGDEFAVILPDTSEEDALKVGDKLIAALCEPFTIGAHRLSVDASVGLACHPRHGDSVDTLLRHADLAMYEAKRGGGGRVAVFSPHLNARAEAELNQEEELRRALEDEELVLYYQPQVTRGIDGACRLEALVRWRHPRQGLLGPDRFIPLAEERGQIQRLGAWVLDRALAQLVAWDAAGVHVPHVAVNVSALELRHGYAEAVEAALEKHGVQPQRLEIEITESALTADGTETIQMLEYLRRLGVAISVDDFGVGYSSLGQLRRLPIDALKIDKSFVDEIHVNAETAAIVAAIVAMAHALQLRMVAEGVENAAQLAKLESLGIDCIQGYLLGRPMPASEVADWLRRAAHCATAPKRVA